MYAHDDANDLAASFRRLARRSRLEALREARITAADYHYGEELRTWQAAIDMLIAAEIARVSEIATAA